MYRKKRRIAGVVLAVLSIAMIFAVQAVCSESDVSETILVIILYTVPYLIMFRAVGGIKRSVSIAVIVLINRYNFESLYLGASICNPPPSEFGFGTVLIVSSMAACIINVEDIAYWGKMKRLGRKMRESLALAGDKKTGLIICPHYDAYRKCCKVDNNTYLTDYQIPAYCNPGDWVMCANYVAYTYNR